VRDDLHARVAAALDAAHAAGDLIRSRLGHAGRVDHKSAVDTVSETDRAAEALLRDRLLGAFPRDALLAEEGSASDGDSGWRWVVDPIDGTTNFIHGHPAFAVSIGLERDGRAVAGCVHAPAWRETFHAVEGEGAFLDGSPIRVSAVDRLDDALLATGFPYNRREIVDDLLRQVRAGVCAAQGIRRCGSAALDLCFVASGRLDGYWEQGLHPWDMAAGVLIVREAGGTVTDFDGSGFDLGSGRIVASNGRIHAGLQDTIAGALGR
jgi:myo-inositol-1(or 4)-monophosphatase